MTRRPRFVHALSALPLLGLLVSGALAPAGERGRGVEAPARVAAPALAADAAIGVLRAAGYGQVSKLEWEGDLWDARANDAQGRRLQICVDAIRAAVAPCRR